MVLNFEPELLCAFFSPLKQDLYRGHGTKFHLKELFFSCGEGKLAGPLRDVQNAFPSVQLGSYPSDSSSHSYQVKVMMESTDLLALEEVRSHTRRRCASHGSPPLLGGRNRNL